MCFLHETLLDLHELDLRRHGGSGTSRTILYA